MPTIHTDLPAVVLDSQDYGESDKIITFFCEDIGKLSGIAKGAHRSKKRFVNKLELFSFLLITYSRSTPGSLAVINNADLINSFIAIRSSQSRYHAASVLREFILLATSEQLGDDNLLKLILWALHAIDKGGKHEIVIVQFLVKLFDCIGYRPDFSQCQGCGAIYKKKASAVFSPQASGLICASCISSGGYSGRQLSPGTIQMIAATQHQRLDKLSRVKLSDILLREALDSLYRYSRYIFQKDIHSWKTFLAGQ
jgi:DNA repair protein RecO (recombination protein O)